MHGINICSTYATNDNKFISLFNIKKGVINPYYCALVFDDNSRIVVDFETYEHIINILSNVYIVLQVGAYHLIKPNQINYIYVTDTDITLYLAGEDIVTTSINLEPLIFEYMQQNTLTTKHFNNLNV